MMAVLPRKDKKHFENRVILIGVIALLIVVSMSAYGAATGSSQQTFGSPAEAFGKMVATLKNNNDDELTAIFGPDKKDILPDDREIDQKSRAWFLKAYNEKHHVKMVDENQAVLYVGRDDWPWPVPVVKAGERWRFDTEEGKKEILARMIGENETTVVRVCLAYVQAQLEYAQDHTRGEQPEYAREFVGKPGQEDGLCNKAKENDRRGPLGSLIAGVCESMEKEKGPSGKAEPFYGYYYRILKKQGPDAPGGEYDYLVNGRMIGGFALVAYPAFYRSTGIMTFFVNQDDLVYQKDLGPETEKTAEAMTTYNPDLSWEPVGD